MAPSSPNNSLCYCHSEFLAMGWSPFLTGSYPSTSAFVYLPGRDKDLGTLHPAVAGESTQCVPSWFWVLGNAQCLLEFTWEHPKTPELDLIPCYPRKNYVLNQRNCKIWGEIMSTRDLREATITHISLTSTWGFGGISQQQMWSWCINPSIVPAEWLMMRGRGRLRRGRMAHEFRPSSWRGKFGNRKEEWKEQPTPQQH